MTENSDLYQCNANANSLLIRNATNDEQVQIEHILINSQARKLET